MKRLILFILIIASISLAFIGCDFYLSYLSSFGISANVTARLKVDGQVWGLASYGGYLYAIAQEEETGLVVYKIEEETMTLESTYPLSGGQVEDKFQDYESDGSGREGGRFQGYTDSIGIFYIIDSHGGRIWLNENETTARYLTSDSYSFYFTVGGTGGTEYAISSSEFQDISIYDIQSQIVIQTLNLDGSYKLEQAMYASDTGELRLLFIPATTDSGDEVRQTITCQAVTLDTASIGSWSIDYPYGGTAVSLDFGDTEYTWTYEWEDSGAGLYYAYPYTQSFFGNDELYQVFIKDVADAEVWLFDLDGTFTDIMNFSDDYRPILASSGRVMFGAKEKIILKYRVD